MHPYHNMFKVHFEYTVKLKEKLCKTLMINWREWNAGMGLNRNGVNTENTHLRTYSEFFYTYRLLYKLLLGIVGVDVVYIFMKLQRIYNTWTYWRLHKPCLNSSKILSQDIESRKIYYVVDSIDLNQGSKTHSSYRPNA